MASRRGFTKLLLKIWSVLKEKTNGDSLKSIKTNFKKNSKRSSVLLKIIRNMEKNSYKDIANARERDIKIHILNKGSSPFPKFLIIIVIVIMLSCFFLLSTSKTVVQSQSILHIITVILTFCSSCLKDIFIFYFGGRYDKNLFHDIKKSFDNNDK
jgi:hypothetical protein